MSEFKINEDGELVDADGNVVADETAVAIAQMLKKAHQAYESDRDLFVSDRELRKTGGQSNRMLMAKMERVVCDDEVKDAFTELLGDFFEKFEELQAKSAGVLSLLWNETQKGGRIFDYLIGEASEVTSRLTLDAEVPSIEDLQKRATKVRGLWTSLNASVESIEAIQALGVPVEKSTKGRADGSTWTVRMSELPKIKTKSEPDEIAVLYCDGNEIWRTNPNGITISNALSVSVKDVKFTDFERQMQLSSKIDSDGNQILDADGNVQQQDIWSVNFDLKGHTFYSKKVKA